MLFNIFNRKKELQKLPFTTDIHNHIVPGVDDGSHSISESIELLEHMADWGITRVYASPHSTHDTFENTPQSIQDSALKLKAEIQSIGMPIDFDYHMEYRIDEYFMRHFESGDVITLPNKYILIENTFSHEPWGLEQLLYRIKYAGYTPILAHPERYRYYSKRNRHRYEELHNFGLYFQLNLLSLAGHYGKDERDTALYLLENGLVQFIGTDLHRMSHVESIEKYLSSKNYLKDLKYLSNLQNDTI